MNMSRRRLPTVIKAAKGTLRADRTNPNEPEYILLHEIPDPPPYLSEAGRKVYFTTAAELQELGLLNAQNFSLFVGYCIQLSTYFHAREELAKSPLIIKSSLGEPRANPYIKIANDSLMTALKIGAEFGITPATAGKVSTSKIKTTDPKQAKLERWANYAK